MKMLKGVTSEYFHTHTALIDFFPKLHETPMFQEFRTHACLITVLFPIWVYVYALFLRLTVYSQSILRCQCFLS